MGTFKLKFLFDDKREFVLNDYQYLGSEASCGICINQEGIDRRHALFEVKENEVYVKDLKSKTGVFVGGTKIIEAKLTDGDIVRAGECELMLIDESIIEKAFPVTSRSDYWSEQLQKLNSVARTHFPVLLLGPSGSGKDIIAQALHKNSDRQAWPFLSVNCSALTETLVESELFGHVKGSFTGAIADRKGAFETARNGTLFLDEIGDLPYAIQAKLLRALENNEIRPVGSDRPVKTDIRIIAATHQNLYQKIREGSFRADLFYRLNVVCVEVPSLKDRLEDFDDLLYDFAKKMRVRFSVDAINTLKKHDWPGNIRELKNMVARASALFPKQSIESRHIPLLLSRKEKLAHAPTGVSYAGENEKQTLSVIKEIEKQMIIKRLIANNGNQKRTALDLGMPKSTLHDRIRNYKIKKESVIETEEFRPVN